LNISNTRKVSSGKGQEQAEQRQEREVSAHEEEGQEEG